MRYGFYMRERIACGKVRYHLHKNEGSSCLRLQEIGACDEGRLEEIPYIVLNLTPSMPLTLENLTALIEWITYAMEYVALPQEAGTVSENQLSLHATLACVSEGWMQGQAIVS